VEARECEVRVVADIVEPGGIPRGRPPLRLDETGDAFHLRSHPCRVCQPSIERIEKASTQRFCGRRLGLESVEAAIGHPEHDPVRGCILI
jgi:hypothetical protein